MARDTAAANDVLCPHDGVVRGDDQVVSNHAVASNNHRPLIGAKEPDCQYRKTGEYRGCSPVAWRNTQIELAC